MEMGLPLLRLQHIIEMIEGRYPSTLESWPQARALLELGVSQGWSPVALHQGYLARMLWLGHGGEKDREAACFHARQAVQALLQLASGADDFSNSSPLDVQSEAHYLLGEIQYLGIVVRPHGSLQDHFSRTCDHLAGAARKEHPGAMYRIALIVRNPTCSEGTYGTSSMLEWPGTKGNTAQELEAHCVHYLKRAAMCGHQRASIMLQEITGEITITARDLEDRLDEWHVETTREKPAMVAPAVGAFEEGVNALQHHFAPAAV